MQIAPPGIVPLLLSAADTARLSDSPSDELKFFTTICRLPVSPFVVTVKAGAGDSALADYHLFPCVRGDLLMKMVGSPKHAKKYSAPSP